MRRIDYIVDHCSATKPDENFGVEEFRKWHKKKGWDDVGYHFIVRLDGKLELGRPLNKQGAHVRGKNKNSIGICYVGGYNAGGFAEDTRTDAQKETLWVLHVTLKAVHPKAIIKGHRDFSPDLDGDGVISPNEYIKQCPCYDAGKEYKDA